MGILHGWKAGRSPEENTAAELKARYWGWVWFAVSAVAFTLLSFGCLFNVTRWLYIADFRGLRFAYFGMCNNDGSRKCTASLLKQSFALASELGSAQNTAADVQRLQNDITFASSGLALFGHLIGMLWMHFYDGEQHIEIYYVSWFTGWWITSIALSFNAAWAMSFGAAALKHSQPLSNTDVSIGIAYILLLWTQFWGVLWSALITISWAADRADYETTGQRQKFKAPYFDALAPRDRVTMEILKKQAT